MNCCRIAVGIAVCAIISLFYVHQQTVVICLGYDYAEKKQIYTNLCDMKKELTYERTQLTDVARIQQVLETARKPLVFAKNAQIVRITDVRGEQPSEPAMPRNPVVKVLASVFSASRVEAKPEDGRIFP